MIAHLNAIEAQKGQLNKSSPSMKKEALKEAVFNVALELFAFHMCARLQLRRNFPLFPTISRHF